MSYRQALKMAHPTGFGVMPYEIERKFLVRDESWRASASQAVSIQQGYVNRNRLTTTRVRIIDGLRAFLTIKSAPTGIRRLEFEYEIPVQDAASLMKLRESGLIEKLRYKLPWDHLTWEIDVFQGENQGLIVAEIELLHEDKVFGKPDWLGREITSDHRYSNASLAMMPFRRWPDSWQRVHLIEPGSEPLYDGLQGQCGGWRRQR